MIGKINDKVLRIIMVGGEIATITYNVEDVNQRCDYARYRLKIISNDNILALKLGDTQSIPINTFIDATRIEANADMTNDFFVLLDDNDNLEELKQRCKCQMRSAIIRRRNAKARKKHEQHNR